MEEVIRSPTHLVVSNFTDQLSFSASLTLKAYMGCGFKGASKAGKCTGFDGVMSSRGKYLTA
jgi:hypothetical protein